jgi:acyl-CoA synthetase (AMP-forming)/AMP-acid ligase II
MFWHDRPGANADAVFLIDHAGRHSYSDVFRLGDALFADCHRAVVAILCDRSVATVAAYFGALRRGIVPLLLDGRGKALALGRTLAAYEPRYLLGDAEAVPEGYRAIRQLGVKTLFERREAVAHRLHDDLALLLPTSGSTGDPKCVRLTARNIEACTQAIVNYLAMTSQRITVSLLPFHYSYGLSVLHNTAFVRASILLTEQSILEHSLWQSIEDAGVTDIAGVPFTFETMRRIRLSDRTLANLVCVTQAGGRLAPHLTQYFAQYFAERGVRYFTMYGQTEAAPRISYVPPERAEEKLGSVGVTIPGGCAKIIDAGPQSGEGELVYEGPNVAMGYASGFADLAEGDHFGGRLHTGDIARIDADGFITIVGRKKRFIKLHGISVNLDHAESVLMSAGVNCMLVGQENRLVVCAVGLGVEAVQRAISENFDFHPSVVRVEICDTLPRTASNKPDYALLTQRFLAISS